MKRRIVFQPRPRFVGLPGGALQKRIPNLFSVKGHIVHPCFVVSMDDLRRKGIPGTPVAMLATMQPTFLPAPQHVAALCEKLRVKYNGEQEAFRTHPAQAILTVDDPASPAHRATFSVPAATLSNETLQTAFDEIVTRFSVA